jgi:hypothetical protein
MPMNDDHARFMDLGFEPRRSPPAPKRTFDSRRRPGRSCLKQISPRRPPFL